MKPRSAIAILAAGSCWMACSASRTDRPGEPVTLSHAPSQGASADAPDLAGFSPLPSFHPSPSATAPGSVVVDGITLPLAGATTPSFNKTIVNNTTGGGELEVAASPDGQNIVVFSAFTTATVSNDYGNTFNPAASFAAPANQGDPQVSVGRSGNFYAEYISWPTGAFPNRTCGNSISWSQDGGRNWTIRSNVVVSAATGVNSFFPDQEQIAADRFAAAPGGGDQVYSAWRNFVSTAKIATDTCDPTAPNAPPSIVETPTIICSTDSAATWVNQKTIDSTNATADFPRITVGPDSFVYVTYLVPKGGNQDIWINKFSTCSSGLNQQANFPQKVASNITPVDCGTGVQGFDRCVGVSHMAAVDDTNANHVYVVYATNTAAGVNENVMVVDSLNGGVNWRTPIKVNTATNSRRLQPSICTTQGNAFVSWFDQRAGTTGPRSDLMDYYGNSVSLGTGAGQPLTTGNELRISQNSDPACRSGFGLGVREAGDESQCPEAYGNVGQCKTTTSGTPPKPIPCDPWQCSRGNPCSCNAGDTCVGVPTGGFPKFGDYMQGACAAGRFYVAWNDATAVPALPALATLGISLACPPNPGVVNASLTADTTPPVIRATTVPGPVPLTACGPTSITPPTAYDACGPTVPNVTASVGGTTVNLTTYAFGCGATTVTWKATDGAGNVSAPGSSTVVTVTDAAPTLSGLSTVNLVDCQPTAHTLALPTPTVSDTCGGTVLSGSITAINGTTLTSPIPVSATGQTTVGPGVLTVKWSATNCSGVSATPLTQTIKLLTAPALYATSSLNIGLLASVVTASNQPATVENAGTGLVNLTTLGLFAQTGSILSVPSVALGPSTVTAAAPTSDAIHTAGIVTGLFGSTVTGAVVQLNAPTLSPFPSLSPSYPFNLNEVIVLPLTTVTIAPGPYDNVVVNPAGTLRLTHGTYTFNTLNVDPAGTVQIDTTGGPVIVEVQTQILHMGAVTSNGAPNQFVLYYSGIVPVLLLTNFSGVVIAPSAVLTLSQPLFGSYVGAFYANSIVVSPGVKVTESPYACNIP
jgi:hypothetical protein